MRVVCHDERQTGLARKAQNALVHGLLLGKPVVLQLQIKMLRPENLRVLQCGLFRAFIIFMHERLRHAPGQARRQRDQPLGVLPQQIHIHTRAVVKAV